MTVNGIDVASFQSTTYDTAGLGFVIVKATEGTGYVNPKHKDQVAHARAAGLVVGHYHYAKPGSMTDQAAYFIEHAAPAAGDLLVLDWEDSGVSNADKDAWIKHVQSAAGGHRVLLYCNKSFWLHRDTTSFCGDGLWIADPDSAAGHPAVEHPWTIHQYSSAGGTDRNVANFKDAAALKAWAAGTTPTPTPEVDVAITAADGKVIAKAWLDYDGAPAPAAGSPYANSDAKTNTTWTMRYWAGDVTLKVREAAKSATDALNFLKTATPIALTDAQVAALGQQLAAAPGFVGAIAAAVADQLAQRLES